MPAKQRNRPFEVMVRHLYGFATTQAGGQRGRDFSQRAFCLFYEQLWDNRQRFNAIKQQLQKLITMREYRAVARIRD
jgi:hypothetical protein